MFLQTELALKGNDGVALFPYSSPESNGKTYPASCHGSKAIACDMLRAPEPGYIPTSMALPISKQCQLCLLPPQSDPPHSTEGSGFEGGIHAQSSNRLLQLFAGRR